VGGALKATYVYSGQGQRVKKIEAVSPNRTIVYHYGLGGELLGETIYGGGGAKIGERDYVWIDTLPLAQSERTFSGGAVTSSQLVYVHADQLDTPRLATNAGGTVVWRWDSDAFGIGSASLDPDADMAEVNVRLRFPGQYLDDETGLHYNYFRDFDPVTGRYIESDPIGLEAGVNTYAYVGGNPVANADPLGLMGRGGQPSRSSTSSGSLRFGGGSAVPLTGPFGPVCGPEGSRLATFIPDGGKRLTAACVAHDKCYATCGSSKFQCDLDLYGHGNFFYWLAVTVGGGESYRRAQANCTSCGGGW
jgi:RHS repeat-associated protein